MSNRALQPFVRAVIEFGLSDLLAQATGSTFPNVSSDQLENIPWPALALSEQCAVANILGAFDNKIELNRRMNETLEALARALFAFQEEKEAWDEVPLGDVCTIYDGPHATPKQTASGPIFLGISNLADGLLNLASVNHISEQDFTRWTRRVYASDR